MAPADASGAWYQEFFTHDYLDHWGAGGIPAERSEKEADFIVDVLGLAPGSDVLDLCCGPGRHAVLLAARGCRVVGVDLSEELLDAAERATAEAQVEVTYIRSDMREIDFDGQFDAIVNMFTAFGYLESDQEHLKVLCAVARALKPGGKFLIDVMNRDGLMSRYQPRRWRETKPGWLMLEDRQFDPTTGRHASQVTLIGPDGQRCRHTIDLRMYTYTELVRLMEEAGLEPVEAYGSFDKTDFVRESHRMIVVAEKADSV